MSHYDSSREADLDVQRTVLLNQYERSVKSLEDLNRNLYSAKIPERFRGHLEDLQLWLEEQVRRMKK